MGNYIQVQMLVNIIIFVTSGGEVVMKKSLVVLVNKQYSNRQNLYLKDPYSDLFVIVNEKIYPLHKNFLKDVAYFSSEEFKNEKVHMIDSNLDEKHFQMIIGYFYGKQLQFLRNWSIQKLLQSIRFLQVPVLQQKILDDIEANFDEYGFFLLLSIAHRFKIKWLKEQCQQQLTLMGFEQLNYNRYDLFQVDKDILEEIIKLHEILKVNQNIIGLRYADLKRILNQYCKANNVEIQVDQMLTSCETSIGFSKNIGDDVDISPKKRNVSELGNENSNPEVQRQLANSKTAENISSIIISHPVGVVSEEKKDQLQRLKMINSQIQQKNNKLIAQIRNVKENIYNTSTFQSQSDEIECIDERFKKFEKTCQEQQEKYLNLKSQMEKLSPISRRSSNTQSEVEKDFNVRPVELSNISSLAKQKSTSAHKIDGKKASDKEMMPTMPRLDRNMD